MSSDLGVGLEMKNDQNGDIQKMISKAFFDCHIAKFAKNSFR